MIDKVSKTIEKYSMLSPGESVAVGLSGGADSVCLLLILKNLGYDVRALHINHGLRGGESDRDEDFCKKLCRGLSVPLEVSREDVKGYCGKNRCSIELGARELRYKALERMSQGFKIALAHTLSDCLETSVFNMSRGGGTHGLASIPPVRGNIVRPLIDCTRSEIEDYLKTVGQEYVTDSTNLIPDCSRNIIRLNIIPELKKINPGLESAYLNSVRALREDDEFIEKSAQKALSECGGDFTKIPDGAVLSRAISIILRQEGIEPSYDRISRAKEMLKTGGRINIKKGVYMLFSSGRISFERDEEPEPEYITDLKHELRLPEKTLTVTKISPFDISRYQKNELRFILDLCKVAGEYTVRHVRGSEKIRLAGRGMTQTVKKLMDVKARARDYVIADSEGVIYIEGVGISERVSCTEETSSGLRIDIIKENENDVR